MMHQNLIIPKSLPLFPSSPFNFKLNSSSPMRAKSVCCLSRHFSLSTQSLHVVPLPPSMEVHLWYMVPDEVKSSSLLNQYLDILSPSEKQNVLSFRTEEQRKRALLARVLVRTTISRYQTNSHVDPRSLRFTKNSFGKPEVDWQHFDGWSQPPLHFNISHTSSLIACGITTHSPIGIDVEEKKRRMKNSVVSFARRFFCPDEAEQLASIKDTEVQRQEFLKLWTLKEAYVKALGRGFSAVPFNTFRIQVRAYPYSASTVPQYTDFKVSEIYAEPIHSSNSRFHFILLELADTHYAAICTEKNPSVIEGNEASPVTLRAWKTIPFSEDLCMSRTSSVVTIGGFAKQLGSLSSD